MTDRCSMEAVSIGAGKGIGLIDVWSRALLWLTERIREGHLTVVLPDGSSRTTIGPDADRPQATLMLRRPRVARRLFLGGDVGFAEAYMDGDWDSPDLAAVIELATRNERHFGSSVTGLLPLRAWHRFSHLLRANSRRGSRRNIAAHYDLGNAFYRLWLDSTMTYSSALFENDAMTLEEAHLAKYRRLAELLDLHPGHRVLEIGCGWGGFATMAARDFGCRVTALTLSREQWNYSRRRVREAGLSDRVEVRLQDYRDVDGTFDRVVSIEMFEAVGEADRPVFFRTLTDRLAPGGRAGLQIISIEEERFASYRKSADFIQRYVFPGGTLPSPETLRTHIRRAGLDLCEEFAFGPSYARTLAAWQRRFREAWPEIERLGFDPGFRRLWEYYLAYCEGGFRAGSVDVSQIIVQRPRSSCT